MRVKGYGVLPRGYKGNSRRVHNPAAVDHCLHPYPHNPNAMTHPTDTLHFFLSWSSRSVTSCHKKDDTTHHLPFFETLCSCELSCNFPTSPPTTSPVYFGLPIQLKTFSRYHCCGSILFPLFQTHYHQIAITKTKEIKFEPRIKLNQNIMTSHLQSTFSAL